MPSITTRAQWGAAPPRREPTRVTWLDGGDLWVHYSDGPPPALDPDAEANTVRGIQRFHQGPTRGWNDIGYAYLVAPSGRIYEGRGSEVLAAHCPGHNSEASVCLMWKSATELPPKAALDSVLWLRWYLGMGRLRGHREGTSTGCPGNAIMAWVQANRTAPALPAAVLEPAPPWGAYVAGKRIKSGRLIDPLFIRAISGALRSAGHAPPYVARVVGLVVARGKFWLPGEFTRRISAQLRAGREVVINDHVTLKSK